MCFVHSLNECFIAVCVTIAYNCINVEDSIYHFYNIPET